MSVAIRVPRSSTNVPLTLSVSKNGGVPGLIVTVAIRDSDSTNRYLDWTDNTFKTSGWGLRYKQLQDLTGGIYALPVGINLSTVSGLPASTLQLSAEYSFSGSAGAGVGTDVIVLESFEADTTAALTQMAANIVQTLRIAKNKIVINFSTQELELYDDAGTAIIQRWPLQTNGGEPVTTQPGVQTKRLVPLL